MPPVRFKDDNSHLNFKVYITEEQLMFCIVNHNAYPTKPRPDKP